MMFRALQLELSRRSSQGVITLCLKSPLQVLSGYNGLKTVGQQSYRNMSGESQERKCTPKIIEGVWFNELGSKIDLKVGDGGIITGKYHTAVQVDEPTGLTANIIGGMSPDGSQDTFGFSVVWNSAQSTTSWAGEYKTCCGVPVLYTTWLLTEQTESCNDNWKSTIIGKDVFTRYKQRAGPPPKDGKITRCHALGLLNKSD